MSLLVAVAVTLTGCSSGHNHRTTARATPTAKAPSTPPAPSPSPAQSAPAPSYGVLAPRAPVIGFVPTSTSFVSTSTGWFLGTSRCGDRRCAVLFRTRDAGRTFTRVPPPPVPVASIRFADLNEGWAFGGPDRGSTRGDPGLWRTHDGGRNWKRVLDRPVPTLEAGAGSVWAVVLDTGGTNPQVFRGGVHADGLHHVTAAGNRSAALTLRHGTVYVVGQQGAGPIASQLLVIESDGTQHRYPSPCEGTPAVAAGAPHRLVAVCVGEPAAGTQSKHVYASTDDGRTWTRRRDAPLAGYADPFLNGSLAATKARTFLSGGRSPLYRETSDGPWRAAVQDDDGSGFSYIGFTDDRHGVALGQRAAWLSSDAGTTWRRLHFG